MKGKAGLTLKTRPVFGKKLMKTILDPQESLPDDFTPQSKDRHQAGSIYTIENGWKSTNQLEDAQTFGNSVGELQDFRKGHTTTNIPSNVQLLDGDMSKQMAETREHSTRQTNRIEPMKMIIRRPDTAESTLHARRVIKGNQIENNLRSIEEVEEIEGPAQTHKGLMKRVESSVSMIFEFGDDEKNEKKMAELDDKYYYLQHEVANP